jgi:hypothetical protein
MHLEQVTCQRSFPLIEEKYLGFSGGGLETGATCGNNMPINHVACRHFDHGLEIAMAESR